MTDQPTPAPAGDPLRQRIAEAVQDGPTWMLPRSLAEEITDAVLAELQPELDRLRKADQEATDTATAAALMVSLVKERADRAEAELDRVRAERTSYQRSLLQKTQQVHEQQAAIERVRDLADRWDRDAPPPGNRPLTELRAALEEPQPCAQHPTAPVIGGMCGGCTQYPADMRPAPAAVCRRMETRTCPPTYNGPCGARPCARFESDDPTPWETAPAHDAGPTVREAAEADRAHWNDKYAGEAP